MKTKPQKINEIPTHESPSKDEFSDVLSAYLAEYGVMRDEIYGLQSAQNQLVLYSLLAVGVAIPILASLIQNQVWVSLLIAPMFFSSMAWVYAGYLGMSYRISIYIHAHLRPAINELVKQKSSSPIELIAWEKFARTNGLGIFATPKSFEIFLFILPSIVSCTIYFIAQKNIGFNISGGEWTLFGLDIVLTAGALIMALVLAQLAVVKLTQKEKNAG